MRHIRLPPQLHSSLFLQSRSQLLRHETRHRLPSHSVLAQAKAQAKAQAEAHAEAQAKAKAQAQAQRRTKETE